MYKRVIRHSLTALILMLGLSAWADASAQETAADDAGDASQESTRESAEESAEESTQEQDTQEQEESETASEQEPELTEEEGDEPSGRQSDQQPDEEVSDDERPADSPETAESEQGDETLSESAATPLPLDDLRVFTEVFGRIKAAYVEPVSDEQLLQDAIQGMLSGLDPHSVYLNEEAYEDMQVGTDGKFGGLGIEVTTENGMVRIIAPIDDTPAQRAGLQAGDYILRIDSKPVRNMVLDDAIESMRGEPGTDIELTILREGEANPFDVTLTRAIIKIASVKSRLLEDGFAYVRITQFQASTAESLRKQLSRLQQRNDGPLKGLVLDLRNNPGGLLNGAVSVVDAFISEGDIVSTKGRLDSTQLNFSATKNDYLEGAPIVVLVNGGSASAAEIVAGALQDHNRAVIMGTRTFGKGSVQTVLPVGQNGAVKLTTARYYTPSDRSIQAEGIEPDILVEDLTVSRRSNVEVSRLREEDLPGHLENDTGEHDEHDDDASDVGDDYQLSEALNLLRGLAIYHNQPG